jgi:WD40 repeat protein
MVIEHMMLHPCSQVTLLWQSDLCRLLCGGSDGTVTCWSCSSAPIKLFANQIHSDSVRVITNISGMDAFVTSGNDGKVFLLDHVTHKVRRCYKGHLSNVHSVCWEPTLKLILTASISSEIIGYSPYSDRELFRLVKHLVAISGLYVAPLFLPARFEPFSRRFVMADAPILLSWDVSGSVCVWDLSTTDFHQMLFLHHEIRGGVQCVIPVLRRHVLHFVGPRYIMPIDFSVSSFPHLADDDAIVSARYSDAYSMIATATARTIRLWNAKTGRVIRTIEPQISGDIVSLSTDVGGKKLFVCGSAGAAYRMDFASGIITHEYTAHSVTVEQHAVSASGQQEITKSNEKREVSAAVYVPEDCAVVTCGWDAKVIVHDDINDCAHGKTSLRVMEAHRKDLNCVAVSWSCRLIAAAGVEGFISCWDYEQPGGKSFDFCMGHTMDTTALAFLEPYPLLSSCDSSGNVAIWVVPPYHPSTLQCVG